MGKIHLGDVTKGMVLADDLATDQGRFLFPRGTVLDERHFRVLRIWGVSVVDVEEPELNAQSPQVIPEEHVQAARDIVERRFRLNDLGFPVLAELAKICTARLAAGLAAGELSIPAAVEKGSAKPARAAEAVPEGPGLDGPADEFRTTAEAVWTDEDGVLASMPSTLAELVEVVNDPRCSSMELSRVVERDAALTARLLKLVNSSFYGFPSRIDTISRAVTIVGSRQLTTLAVGVAAITHFRDIPAGLMNMEKFWRHSLRAGLACRLLASHMNTPNSERFFVAGLLHDIGRLALFRLQPQGVAKALAAAAEQNDCTHRVERRVFGFDHGEMGGLMFKAWTFPVVLENAVRHHHDPLNSPNLRESAVVHFADAIAHALDEDLLDEVVPQVNVLAWESLGLPAVSLPSLVEQLDFLFNQTADCFLGATE